MLKTFTAVFAANAVSVGILTGISLLVSRHYVKSAEAFFGLNEETEDK